MSLLAKKEYFMSLLSHDEVLKLNSDCGNPECTLMDNLEFFRKTSLFSGISLEIIKLFAYLSRVKEFKKGELICKKGERADKSFFIVEGQVEPFKELPDNQVFLLQKMGPFEFFSELALLADFEVFINVKACTDVKLLLLDRKSFQKILSKFEDKQYEIIEHIVQLRLKRFKNQMTELAERFKKTTKD